jgi:hypothetical protein
MAWHLVKATDILQDGLIVIISNLDIAFGLG